MKKIGLVLIIISMLILATACWDMKEINERIFPYSVGLDVNHGEGGQYMVTISYININGIGKNATQEERVFVVSTPASSVFEASKILGTKIPYPIYFKHLRVLILGEELAKNQDDIRQIADGLSRDFVINKKVNIVTSEGKAQDLLEAVPDAIKQEEIEGSIFALLKDNRNISRYTTKTLTGFIQDMDRGDTIIPRIKIDQGDIKVFGGSIVKDYRVIGHINEEESRAISFIRDEVKMELIDVPYNGSKISYEIVGQSRKRKLLLDEEGLTMKIDIEVEGVLQEYILMDASESDGEGELQAMEEAIKHALGGEIQSMVDLLQRKYKADPVGVEEYISKFHPRVWKEVSKDWEEIYPRMKIDISLDPKIRRRGLIK